MKTKYSAGDHHDSSIINISLCSTLVKKRKKAFGKTTIYHFTTERVILLGVKLPDFKENSWLQRVPLLCRFWCLVWFFNFTPALGVSCYTMNLKNCLKMTDEKSRCNADEKTKLRLKLLWETDKRALARQTISELTHRAVSGLSREIL